MRRLQLTQIIKSYPQMLGLSVDKKLRPNVRQQLVIVMVMVIVNLIVGGYGARDLDLRNKCLQYAVYSSVETSEPLRSLALSILLLTRLTL